MNYNLGEQGREGKVSVQEGENGAESWFIGYLRTWSAYWTYLEKYPHLPGDPLDELQSRWVRLGEKVSVQEGEKKGENGAESGFIGYLRTWSAYWTYLEKYPHLPVDPLDELQSRWAREGREGIITGGREGAESGFIGYLRMWSAYWTYLEKYRIYLLILLMNYNLGE